MGAPWPQDTDGTLFSNATLPADLLSAMHNFTRPGLTFHSAVNSTLFDPSECIIVRNSSVILEGAICSASVTWRRVLLNDAAPTGLFRKGLIISAGHPNRSSIVGAGG